MCFPDLETLGRVVYTEHVRGVQADADDHIGDRGRLIVEEHPVL